MDVCLSHWSALSCWRMLRRAGTLSSNYIEKGACSPLGGPTLRATKSELQRMCSSYGLGQSAHVVVSGANRRHRRSGAIVHSWDDGVNAPCFFELEPGLYLSSPALCYLQLSTELDLLGRVRLGFELCSSYAILESGAITESMPLTSIESIAQLGRRYSVVGSKSALKALDHVMQGSRSPKESELAMKLGLPLRLGGFGLSGFTMNSPVELGQFGREITGKNYCVPDLLWAEQKLDVEYNGKDWHSFPDQRESDLRRRQALAAEGYTVLTVDQRVIESPSSLRHVADEVSMITRGRRVRVKSADYKRRNMELFACFTAEGSHVKERRR